MLLTTAVKGVVCEWGAGSRLYKDLRNPGIQGKDVLGLNRRCFLDERRVPGLRSGCSIGYSLPRYAAVDTGKDGLYTDL